MSIQIKPPLLAGEGWGEGEIVQCSVLLNISTSPSPARRGGFVCSPTHYISLIRGFIDVS